MQVYSFTCLRSLKEGISVCGCKITNIFSFCQAFNTENRAKSKDECEASSACAADVKRKVESGRGKD